MTEITLGQRLKDARERKGLLQSRVAKECGVKSSAVVSAWENDTNKPDIEKLLKLCELYGLSPSYLLGWTKGDDARLIMSEAEAERVERIRMLDDRAEMELDKFLDFQLDFIKSYQYPNKGDAPVDTANRDIDYAHAFLSPDDPDYYDYKEKSRKLKKIKKNAYKSYEDITKFLWDLGYGDNICLGYVIGIFNGVMVPSRSLYNNIIAYLKHRVQYSIPALASDGLSEQ